jgi:stage II sporulation protein R
MIRPISESWKRFAYIAFALIMMLMSWESNNMQAAALIHQDIPQESIRIRILANSDSVADQWVKRKVRDAIVEEMKTWVTGPQSIEEARQLVRSRLADLERLSNDTLLAYGFSYNAKVELDTVPFPEKAVGLTIYPAGQYETLRVTIGKGQGQNWWCVLFPPLCFVSGQIVAKKDVEAKEEADKSAGVRKQKDNEGKHAGSVKRSGDKDQAAEKIASAKGDQAADQAAGSGQTAANEGKTPQPKPEVRFFLWDLLKKLFA